MNKELKMNFTKMKKTTAIAMDCVVCVCPYCGKEVIELNADLNDMTASDIEEETEMFCNHCGKSFLAVIN